MKCDRFLWQIFAGYADGGRRSFIIFHKYKSVTLGSGPIYGAGTLPAGADFATIACMNGLNKQERLTLVAGIIIIVVVALLGGVYCPHRIMRACRSSDVVSTTAGQPADRDFHGNITIS